MAFSLRILFLLLIAVCSLISGLESSSVSPTEVLEELQCHVRPNLPNTLRIVPKKILETLAEIEVALTKYYETIQQGEGGYLSVVYGEQTLFSSGFGQVRTQNNENGHKPDKKTTRWPLASITKVFTDLLLLVFKEEEIVPSLDYPLVNVFPNFRMLNFLSNTPDPLFNSSSDEVTFRMLGSHLAGLPREVPCGKPCNTTTQEVLEQLHDQALILPTFSRASYSNLGFSLLGRALEQLYDTQTESAVPYEDLVAEFILDPLSMTSTTFNETEALPDIPFLPDNQTLYIPNGWDAPAGGLIATADDMEKFIKFFYSADGPSVPLSTASRREWSLEMRTFADGGRTGMALPWEVITSVSSAKGERLSFDGGHKVLTKGGDIGGFHHELSLVPTLRLGILFLSQTTQDTFVNYGVTNQLIRAFDSSIDDSSLSTRHNFLPSNVELYVGTYVPIGEGSQNAPNLDIEVLTLNGYSFLNANGLPPPNPMLSYIEGPDQRTAQVRFRVEPRPDSIRDPTELCPVLADGIYYNYLLFNFDNGFGEHADSMVLPGLHPNLKWVYQN